MTGETGRESKEEPGVQEDETVEEECMLCLESMHRSDIQIPMLCPLDGCPFNYCSQCVWNLLLSSSQPYQEASDGSKQLKVHLQCPQCRTKYPHRQIVQDVLLLRQAARLAPLFFNASQTNESSLKASDLSAREDFRCQVTYEDLRDAWSRVDKYARDRYNEREGFEVDNIVDSTDRLPPLSEEWKEHLIFSKNSSTAVQQDDGALRSNHSVSNIGGGQAQYDIVDPTLFQGMDETMTLSEQEFLSKLLVSGSVPKLMHAAQVLYGMLQIMLHGGLKARSQDSMKISHLAGDPKNGIASSNHNNLRMLTSWTKMLYPDMETAVLRKRFPLPLHMPRWIILPVYNPHKRGVPLQFANHPFGLLITSVKGSAGQQGIRRGDIVTHINEEACDASTPEEFTVYMETMYHRNKEGSGESSVTMVVNAHPETAEALQKRSFEMIHFLTTNQKRGKE